MHWKSINIESFRKFWGIASSVALRMTLHTILCLHPDSVCLLGPNCGSWGIPARHTTMRSFINAWGAMHLPFVHDANKMISLRLGFPIIKLILMHFWVPLICNSLDLTVNAQIDYTKGHSTLPRSCGTALPFRIGAPVSNSDHPASSVGMVLQCHLLGYLDYIYNQPHW